MSEDDDLFKQEMAGVTPLKHEKKIQLRRAKPDDASLKAKRAAAQVENPSDKNFLSSNEVECLDPYYTLEFKRPGVQNGVYRKLKQGKYPQDARLDLHRMTVEQARVEVFDFITQSIAYDVRSLIIVHGKGHHNQSQQARLKSYVNRWLPDMPEVQAFCSAQARHGGAGAVYVLLAKSEQKKQENRDKISRGRIEP